MRISIMLSLFFPIFLFSQSNFEKAEKLFMQEKYSLAKPIFESIYKENPNQLKTIEYLADIASNLEEWDKAIFYYQKLKMLKPNEANYYYKYGGALGMKAKEGGKWVAMRLIGDMRESFEKAIVLNPKHIEARWAMVEYYLQLPVIVGGSERKAQIYSNELFKISPIDGYLSKAHIDEYYKRYKSAEKNYLKAIEIGGSKTSYQKLANLYKNKMNQPERARETMDAFARKG
jgi:tetratricopeptide (TPR) repeat protein